MAKHCDVGLPHHATSAMDTPNIVSAVVASAAQAVDGRDNRRLVLVYPIVQRNIACVLDQDGFECGKMCRKGDRHDDGYGLVSDHDCGSSHSCAGRLGRDMNHGRHICRHCCRICHGRPPWATGIPSGRCMFMGTGKSGLLGISTQAVYGSANPWCKRTLVFIPKSTGTGFMWVWVPMVPWVTHDEH